MVGAAVNSIEKWRQGARSFVNRGGIYELAHPTGRQRSAWTLQSTLAYFALRTTVQVCMCAMLAASSITPTRNARAQLPEWTLPDQFALQTLAAGLTAPTAFTVLPDGSALIAEQAGFVKRYANGTLQLEPALNVSAEVNGVAERGLTGIGVDSDFDHNGFVYLLFTYDKPAEQKDGDGLRLGKLARFTMQDGKANPSSEAVLLDGIESNVPYHAPGSIRVARDGTLFVSIGDGSNPYQVSNLSMRSQDLNQTQGKILHIDRDGQALPSNPFYDAKAPTSVRSKVWAYGFRNPFRFALQPETQVPFVGNVGWNTTESIVQATRGSNFGWPCFESVRRVPEFAEQAVCKSLKNADVTKSDYDYAHNGNNAAVIGGDFAGGLGSAFPEAMRGSFFFGDYSQRTIRRATLIGNGHVTRVDDFAQGIGYPVDLAFGRDGALYFVDILGGNFRRIVYLPNAAKPVVRLSTTSAQADRSTEESYVLRGTVPFTVTFDATGSTASDNRAIRYLWEFEAAAQTVGSNNRNLIANAGPAVTHVYAHAGEYVMRLTVMDSNGWANSVEQHIGVRSDKPRAEILSPGDQDTLLPGTHINLRGRGIGVNGNVLAGSALSWMVVWQDNGQRRTLASGQGNALSFVMPSASPSSSPQRLVESSVAIVTLKVSDGSDTADVTRIRLRPQPRDGYIRSWWLIGGFPQKSLVNDMLPGGEAAFVLPDSPSNGTDAQLLYSSSRKIDFRSVIQPGENNLAYAFVWLDVPTEREALLGMNSDDGIAVWLNGTEVWRNKVARFVPDDTRDLDLPRVVLKKGMNALLVKVDQKLGEWAFKLRVLNPNGSVMRDVTSVTRRSS